ncbi:Lrp/AsnC family transcriptional regulator [Nocardiopsis ganjiahuensis]|uniref:Lrp/AsnC family transcriptional regulator n=1 Tax=Nocardiopsis ganjiahuensis TaxID=239984 RepID=UPI000594B434|nr:Lrp/AsnC family transcriptional regulator [Nocardiopsis ganjiahuensis]
MTRVLDGLERRIAAALQVDGRASWRGIASVLAEPERTVARRGNELLASGAVAVVGILPHADAAVLRVSCSPGTARMATESLAQRSDCTFAYMTTGSTDCVAELMFDSGKLPQVLGTEVPATVGLLTAVSYPVLRYFRTIRGWRSGPLTEAQVAALTSEYSTDHTEMPDSSELTPQDLRIAEVLAENGRAGYEEIARRTGTSESTASRRTDWLLRHGHVHLRALVEPALVGLPVEAVLWIRAAPNRVDGIGRELSAQREVRYAAALAGDHQLVANVTVPDNAALYRFTTESAWAARAESVETTLLLHARKRGGRMLPVA